MPSTPASPRLTVDQLVASFANYGRSRSEWLVGAEFERLLLRENGMPIGYVGNNGIRELLQQFGALGWTLHSEGGNPVAAEYKGRWITLEPGGQFELSDAPCTSVTEAGAQAHAFNQTLSTMLQGTGIHSVALGYTPFAAIEDIAWMPKGRYVQMRDHLIRHGDLAHHMMKGTAATQVSFDYASEADCTRKVQLATGLAPLTTAMFANSPLKQGKPAGYMSFRGHIWTRTDPARTGLPRATTDFSIERWVNYLVDVPMMFVKRGTEHLPGRGLTFRQWMTHGIDGVFPTLGDWEVHQTQVFPEVRVKRQIEIRGADCVDLPLALSFCALFRGLFYCDDALSNALDLMAAFTQHGTHASRFEIATREALAGVVGRPLLDWARDLVDLGGQALNHCAPEDRPLLAPLEAQLATGECPARALLRAYQSDPTVATVLAVGAFRAAGP